MRLDQTQVDQQVAQPLKGFLGVPVPEQVLDALQLLRCLSAGLGPLFLQRLNLLLQNRQPHRDVYRILSINLTMRLTTMGRMTQGVRVEAYPELSADLEEMLEHLKWNLWHGKVDRALEILDELAYALGVEDASPKHRKLLKAVRAFETYVTNHRAFIPYYGERFRQGETISTGFTESAVNQVVSKRFVKKQQMRWTPAGAHLLLQIRVQVLNGDWRSTLSPWYPAREAAPERKAA